MVANLAAPRYEPLSLLVEPLAPDEGRVRARGWTITTRVVARHRRDGRLTRLERVVVRDHRYDAMGAFVQHVIVRYLVHGVERQQLCRETGYHERAVQAWLQGRAFEPYTLAVLARLRELGISHRRGLRPHRYSGQVTRADEIIAAQQRALEQVVGILEHHEDAGARAVVASARLLLAGREPVAPPWVLSEGGT